MTTRETTIKIVAEILAKMIIRYDMRVSEIRQHIREATDTMELDQKEKRLFISTMQGTCRELEKDGH